MNGPAPLAEASGRLRGKPGRPPKVGPKARSEAAQLGARLLDVRAISVYLGGISEWSVRDLFANGILPRVRIPMPGGGEFRKVLADREDLDRLIQAWKDAGR